MQGNSRVRVVECDAKTANSWRGEMLTRISKSSFRNQSLSVPRSDIQICFVRKNRGHNIGK